MDKYQLHYLSQNCNDDEELQSILPNKLNMNTLKNRVFSDLTKKGFFVTQGLKYGATFLAYEGDPLTCHSRFMVYVND